MLFVVKNASAISAYCITGVTVFYVVTYYLLTFLFTYLLHGPQSFLKANRFSASQEIPPILWKPKAHYSIHKCSPPVPTLSQLDPIHTPTSYFLKIHLNIILPRLGLPRSLFPSGFSTKTLNTPLLSPIRATCPAHLILLVFITRTILGEQCSVFYVVT